MTRTVLNIIMLFFVVGASCNSYAQGAKKPKIMVVPSDALLNEMGLYEVSDNIGEKVPVRHYREAFLNSELKAVVTKFGEMMKERGFETVMLENELKRVQGKGTPVNFDIQIDLLYRMRNKGPRKTLYFELSGIDMYSSKQVAASSGESPPAIGATPESLLQEAVLDKIDQFNNQLMATFEEMEQRGRESRLTVISESLSLDDEIGGDSLVDVIENWLDNNCVNANFSTDDITESMMQVSQAMMPLFNEKGKSLDARNFYRELERLLDQKLKSDGYKAKFTKRKLAEVEITIEEI